MYCQANYQWQYKQVGLLGTLIDSLGETLTKVYISLNISHTIIYTTKPFGMKKDNSLTLPKVQKRHFEFLAFLTQHDLYLTILKFKKERTYVLNYYIYIFSWHMSRTVDLWTEKWANLNCHEYVNMGNQIQTFLKWKYCLFLYLNLNLFCAVDSYLKCKKAAYCI